MIDFLKYRTACLIFSVLIFATFIGTCVYRYQTTGRIFNYSVDFTGGTQVLFGFSKPVVSSEISSILNKNGWTGATIREFSQTELLVRTKEVAEDVSGLAEKMRSDLQQALPENTVEIKQTDSVGAGIGASLRLKSLQAILAGLVLMLLFIAFRFWSFAYGMGALVSLFHDAVVILAVFLLLDKEISINIIGAIMTILGYSINDTIVIFSRIRENVKKLHNKSMYEIVNISINETLRRTLLLTTATLLVVISLFLFGGEVLRDFSLALLVGMIFGTYSSVYIANPVMLFLLKGKK
jgi:preprotein translocase subunit SecF